LTAYFLQKNKEKSVSVEERRKSAKENPPFAPKKQESAQFPVKIASFSQKTQHLKGATHFCHSSVSLLHRQIE
jgi:hypothetical protein